jgi:gas vesicle protein
MKNKREETSFSTKLSYLLIGGGIGAIIALLFAPKSGQELRGEIADATRKGIEKGRESAVLVGERAGDYYEVTRERASELYQAAQEKASEYKAKAGELTEKAREASAMEGNEDIDFPTSPQSHED